MVENKVKIKGSEEGEEENQQGTRKREGGRGWRSPGNPCRLHAHRCCCFAFTWPSPSPCGPQADVNDVSHSRASAQRVWLLLMRRCVRPDAPTRRNQSCEQQSSGIVRCCYSWFFEFISLSCNKMFYDLANYNYHMHTTWWFVVLNATI